MPAHNPIQRIINQWTDPDNALELQRIHQLWPALADDIDSLIAWSSRMATEDHPLDVPTVAPAVPRSAPPRHSATASVHHGTEAPSVPLAPGTPIQDTLPSEDDKPW